MTEVKQSNKTESNQGKLDKNSRALIYNYCNFPSLPLK